MSPRTARRGANAAEFAVIAPFILLMTFGMMEYGWYFQQRTAVVEAASDAARVASMVAQTGNPAVTASAKAVASCAALQFRGTCTALTQVTGAAPNQTVLVRVTGTYASLTGLVPTPGTIVAQVVMRREQQPAAAPN